MSFATAAPGSHSGSPAAPSTHGVGGTPIPAGPPPASAFVDPKVATPPPFGYAQPRASAPTGGPPVSHGSGGSPTQQYVCIKPEECEIKVRPHCIWDLNKTNYARMEHRWFKTIQREYPSNVALQLQGNLKFSPMLPSVYHKAGATAESFVLAHLPHNTEAGVHLHEKIDAARRTGTIVQGDGHSLLRFLRAWIIIDDPCVAAEARSALSTLTFGTTFTLENVEACYWWAEAIISRLPPHERTGEVHCGER